GLAVEDLDLRRPARVSADDDVSEAIAVDVAGRYEDAAAELVADAASTGRGRAGARSKNTHRCIQRKRKEARDRLQRDTVENHDLWQRSRTGAGDDVGDAVAVDITDGHTHTAHE